MNDKVVSFEMQYYVSKEKEAQKLYKAERYNDVIKTLKEPILKLEKIIEGDIYCPQSFFEQMVCLNLLGKEVHQNNFAKVNYFDFYLMMASSYNNLGGFEEARKFYKAAIKLDPVSAVARINEMKIELKQKSYDEILRHIQDALFFAYKREDISAIYKIAGKYLVTQKDYQMAMVAYHLGVVYNMDDGEFVELIKECAKDGEFEVDKEDWLSEAFMKKFNNAYQIALMPNQKIIELAKLMGEDARKKGHIEASKEGYKIAYDLSLDEDLKKWM